MTNLFVFCGSATDEAILRSLVESVQAHDGSPFETVWIDALDGQHDLLTLSPTVAKVIAAQITGDNLALVVFEANGMNFVEVEQQKAWTCGRLGVLPEGWYSHVVAAQPTVGAWVGVSQLPQGDALTALLAGVDWNERAAQVREVADVIRFLREAARVREGAAA